MLISSIFNVKHKENNSICINHPTLPKELPLQKNQDGIQTCPLKHQMSEDFEETSTAFLSKIMNSKLSFMSIGNS